MKDTISTEQRSGSSRGHALVLGYVVCDVLADGEHIAYSAGGTSGNVSANLAALGWRVSLQARVGADSAGEFVRQDLACAGVELDGFILDPNGFTPVVVIETKSFSHRYRFRCPHCGARYARYRPVQAVDSAQLQEANIVFFDRASSVAVELAKQARSGGKLVFFEPNTLGRVDLFRRAVEAASIVKFSDQRAPEFIDLLDDAPADQVQICTQGAAGFSVRNPSTPWRRFAAPVISPVDTVGAGDMFTAALLDLLTENESGPHCSVPRVSKHGEEAQWFAVANSQKEGARGLTRCRNRSEVLQEVGDLRHGRDSVAYDPPIATIKNSGDCHDWLCPTATASAAPYLTGHRKVVLSDC
jgi:fructokinase